jgi:hypothetical protein
MTTTADSFPDFDKIISANMRPGGIGRAANQFGHHETCPECGGTGQVWVSDDDGDGNGDVTDSEQLDHLSAAGPLERRSARTKVRNPILAQELRGVSSHETYARDFADLSLSEMNLRRRSREAGLVAYQAAINVLAKRVGVKIREGEPRSGALLVDGSVIIPRPVDAADCVRGLHELAHARLEHLEPSTSWRDEIDAWRLSLGWWREMRLPDYDQACLSASRCFMSYARPAIGDGQATASEILRELPPELSSYRDRLEELAA